MPPEYQSESFWEDRFRAEEHFEWLGDGRQAIIPSLRSFFHELSLTRHSKQPELPRLLHIGAGTSTLSDDLLETYHELFGEQLEGTLIVNTDFSELAVEKGRASGASKWSGNIQWERADMLDWRDIERLLKRDRIDDTYVERRFGAVVDKSTSDAISCGDDIEFGMQDSRICSKAGLASNIHPFITSFLTEHPHDTIKLQPMEVLAIHLATLVCPKGIWIALSYSRDRFLFLTKRKGLCTSNTRLSPSKYWAVEEVKAMDAPSGQGKEGVFAPAIQHFVYVLRRTDVSIDV